MTLLQAPWPDTFQRIVPGIQPWVESLKTTDAAVFVQGLFAQIEVFHILGLFMLGGATILVSLRLIGVGLTEIPASTVEKQTRLWFTIGVVMAIVSGLTIGLSNAEKLYNSTAFLWKMLAMVAGILFSYFVLMPTARKEGEVSAGSRLWMIVALAVWLLGILLMVTGRGSNSLGNVGFFHVLTAGALIALAATQGRMRWVLGLGLLALVVVWQVVTHGVILKPADDDPDLLARFEMANRAFIYLIGIWVFGISALNIMGRGAPAGPTSIARLVGYAAILIWVTVGAGGRWIGLS